MGLARDGRVHRVQQPVGAGLGRLGRAVHDGRGRERRARLVDRVDLGRRRLQRQVVRERGAAGRRQGAVGGGEHSVELVVEVSFLIDDDEVFHFFPLLILSYLFSSSSITCLYSAIPQRISVPVFLFL